MWVYFDAAERGKNAFLWAVGTALTWGLVFFIYLAARTSGPQREKVGGVGIRQYLYIASFCGAFLVSIGLSVSLGALLGSAFSDVGFDSDTRDVVASGVVSAAVGLAVLVVHWRIAEQRLNELPDDEFRAQFATRRLALQTTAAVNGLSAILSALVFFGGALSALLGATYAEDAEAWVTAAAPLLVTGGVALVAWRTFSLAEHSPTADRFRSIAEPRLVSASQPTSGWLPPPPTVAPQVPSFAASPPPPPPPRVTSGERGEVPPRYCGRCGSRVPGPTDGFCASCGAPLPRLDAEAPT